MKIGGAFLEISGETTKQQLKEIGVAEGGKIDNQVLMLKLGLPIPDGIVFSAEAFDEKGLKDRLKDKLTLWLDKYRGKEFQIRCDARAFISKVGVIRNQPTEQGLDSREVIPKLETLFSGFPQDRLAMIQAIPEKGMERDIHSAQILFNPQNKSVTFEVRHDIATILGREGGLPDETWTIRIDDLIQKDHKYLLDFVVKKREVLLPEKLLRNFHHTLMRFGRIEIEKRTGIKIPKIEILMTSTEEKAKYLVVSKYLDKQNFEKIINILAGENRAFLQAGYKLEDFGLPNKPPTELNLGELLSILGFYNLGNFSKVREEYDEYHTMKIRMNRIFNDPEHHGYLHPTDEDYEQLIKDAQYLAKAGILQKNRMPKLSIINAPTGHEFVYWDLIPSGFK